MNIDADMEAIAVPVELGPVLIELDLGPLAISLHLSSPHVPVEVAPALTVVLHLSSPHVDVEMEKEVNVVVDIPINPKEYAVIVDSVVGDNDLRRQAIINYYFGRKYTMAEIAKHFKISKTLVHDIVHDSKSMMLKELKKDLRSNKKVLGILVELLAAHDQRIRENWHRYADLQEDSLALRQALELEKTYINGMRSRRQEVPTERLAKYAENLKALNYLHTTRQGYLSNLKDESKAIADLLDKFGLCGKEAMEIAISGSIDVDVKIKEIRVFLSQVVSIIQLEVKDEQTKMRVFNRIAKQIKESGIYAESTERLS